MKIVIDCDAGIDDAQAIMIALSHEVDLLAITCTFGNVDVDQVSKNVLKILDVCGRTDIPVYKGAHQAMLGTVLSLTIAFSGIFPSYYSFSTRAVPVGGTDFRSLVRSSPHFPPPPPFPGCTPLHIKAI